MKKLSLIITVCLLVSSFILAQESPNDPKHEKLRALKVGYITEKLSLTPTEAQSFWPVYNEMEDKMRAIRHERRENDKSARDNFDKMSDEQLAKAMSNVWILEERELNIKREYTERFRKLLPIRKVVQLHIAEDSFRKELLRGARDKQGRPDRPPR